MELFVGPLHLREFIRLIVMLPWQGDVVRYRNLSLLGDDVLSLQGQAMFPALLITRGIGFDNLIVETDCAILFKALVGGYDMTCSGPLVA